MNKLILLALATLSLLGGCNHSDSELVAAKDVSYALGQQDGRKKGFLEGVQSVSKTVELIVATNKAKFEVEDKQRESELEKALACSNSPINLCPDSWMINIEQYQKLGYTGVAGPQTFWIALTNRVITALLMVLLLFGQAIIYKLLKLESLDQEAKKLDLARKELRSENSKLDDRITNLTAEENQAMRQANRARLIEEEKLNEVRTTRRTEEDELELYKAECLLAKAETDKELYDLYAEVRALEDQKKLFGG